VIAIRHIRLGGLIVLAVVSACHSHDGRDHAHDGAILVTRQACGSCHKIPGIGGADGTVGPSLAHFASQRMIAGALPNTPENLARFLRSPRTVVRDSVMPDQPLTEDQMRNVVAYLYALD
jgi:cytochrome c1